MALENIETNLNDDEYNELWEIAQRPRGKTTTINKELLRKLLMDQAEFIGKLKDYGVSIVPPTKDG